MHSFRSVIALFLVVPLVAGCDAILGEDFTPETVRYRIQGEAGTPVEVVTSREFLAGVTETTGVTQIEMFQADTVVTTLPVDQDLGIALQKRFYLQVTPTDGVDITGARVIVSINGNERFNEAGTLPAESPFRYAYVFNQRVTRVIEVF